MPIKFFSMFSGIGGFEYGMELSNHKFECVGHSEIDKFARSIYERHYPNHINFGDATEIRTEDLPDFDFFVGGFPCQAFSIAGKGRGFHDTRGTLFFEIARVLRDKKPKHFLLENVKNLLSHERGKTFQKILEVIDELGYDAKWKVYNSKNHGVPQNRERIFIKGYSREECGQEILSVGEDKEESSAVINGGCVMNRSAYYYPSPNDTLCACITAEGHHSGGRNFVNVSDFDDRKIHKWGNFSPTQHYGKNIYDPNGLCPTLCAESVVKNGLNIVENEYELERCVGSPRPHASKTNGDIPPCLTAQNYGSSTPILQFKNEKDEGDYLVRRLTPVECERLQGFPDNWTKYGKDGELISDTQRYKTCGNAVTTTVVRDIINEVFG